MLGSRGWSVWLQGDLESVFRGERLAPLDEGLNFLFPYDHDPN